MQSILLTRQQVQHHFSRLGLGFFLMLVVSQVVSTVLTVIVSLVAPALTTTGWFLWVMSYLPLYGAGFPVFLAIVKPVPDTTAQAGPLEKKTVGVLGILMLILISLGIVYPLNILASVLSSLVEGLTGAGIDNTLEMVVLGSHPAINLFFAVIVAPVMEEIIFRGILYKKLVGFGGKVYVLFSAFMFAMYHVNVYQLAYAFALGLVFGALTYFTGTIKYSIILHMTVNLLGSGISPFFMYYGLDMAVNIYTSVLLAMVVVGIVLGIIWLVRRRKTIHFGPGLLAVPTKKDIILNPGVILMIVLFIVLMATVLATPYLTRMLQEMMASMDELQGLTY